MYNPDTRPLRMSLFFRKILFIWNVLNTKLSWKVRIHFLKILISKIFQCIGNILFVQIRWIISKAISKFLTWYSANIDSSNDFIDSICNVRGVIIVNHEFYDTVCPCYGNCVVYVVTQCIRTVHFQRRCNFWVCPH